MKNQEMVKLLSLILLIDNDVDPRELEIIKEIDNNEVYVEEYIKVIKKETQYKKDKINFILEKIKKQMKIIRIKDREKTVDYIKKIIISDKIIISEEKEVIKLIKEYWKIEVKY
jgi:acetyl-CoA carboxylase alpha subunit